MIGNNIILTSSNIEKISSVSKALLNDLENLSQLALKYPIEIEFDEYRFVFSSREEIKELVNTIENKIENYQIGET